jgi:hypothetical protein
MRKSVDRIFCGLFAIAAAGHLFGTFTLAEIGSGLFVWSLSGVLAAALLVALNLLRNARQRDKSLAWITLIGNLCWIGIAILFGLSIGHVLDPRVLFHVIAAAGASYFSFLDVCGIGLQADIPRAALS